MSNRSLRWRRLRAEILEVAAANGTRCLLCGNPVTPDDIAQGLAGIQTEEITPTGTRRLLPADQCRAAHQACLNTYRTHDA